MKQTELLHELASMVQNQIGHAEAFKELSNDILNTRINSKSWSILECLEHLNLYGDFYLISLENSIIKARPTSSDKQYRAGWFGGLTAKSMLPKQTGKLLYKMDAFKDKNPMILGLPTSAIDRFIKQQEQLLRLIATAKTVDLNRNRTPTTLPGMNFKLGDTLRFVIYHQERHMQQALRIQNSVTE